MSQAGAIRAGRAYVAIGADDGQLTAVLARVRTRLLTFGSMLSAVGGGMLAGGVGILGALAWPVKLAADLEKTRTAFQTMLRDGSKVSQLMEDLQKFAAETPFEFPELADAARKLLAFGVPLADLIPKLREVGDISSGISAPLGDIAEIYGKARVQGRLFAEDINQLTGRGIPIIAELAKQFGVAESEVRKLVESGRINFTHLEKAFTNLTTGSGMFAGGMAAQSKTLAGQFSTLRDSINAALRPLGDALLPILGKIVSRLSVMATLVGGFVERNKRLAVLVAGGAAAITVFGAALVAAGVSLAIVGTAIGGIVTGFSAIGTVLGALSSGLGAVVAAIFSPVGLGIVAIVALGAAIYALAVGPKQALSNLRNGITGIYQGALQLLGTLSPIGEAFGRVGSIAVEAWSKIVDAVASGNIDRALEVTSSALSLMWLTTTQGMLQAWYNITDPIRDVWTDTVTAILELANSGFTGILSMWERITSGLTEAWTYFQDFVAIGFDAIIQTFAQLSAAAQHFFGIISDSEYQNKLIGAWEQFGQNTKDRLLSGETGRLQQEQQSAQRLADIRREGEERAAMLRKLGTEEQTQRRGRHAGDLDDAKRRLEAAQRAFNAPKPEGDTTADLARRLKERATLASNLASQASSAATKAAGFSTSGTFNAAQARGLGFTSIAERTAKAAELTATNTTKLVDKASEAGAVYA